MLAYLFWHWPVAEIAADAYEARLVAFQQAMRASGLPGFQASAVWRVSGAAWTGPAAVAYEDWYLVADFAALEALNAGAVTGARQAPHARAAAAAAGGTAGLYRHVGGDAQIDTLPVAAWLGKPDGVTYERFYADLADILSQPAVGLWQRQMTLGPTPEFCLLSASPLTLLAPLAPRLVRRTLVWPDREDSSPRPYAPSHPYPRS
jgi:hypothetical protein